MASMTLSRPVRQALQRTSTADLLAETAGWGAPDLSLERQIRAAHRDLLRARTSGGQVRYARLLVELLNRRRGESMLPLNVEALVLLADD